ncbi:MAG: class D sortase [Rudaea sp.]
MQTKRIEVALWTIGVLLLVLFVGVLGWQEVERRHEIDAFQTARRTLPSPVPSPRRPPSQHMPSAPVRILATPPGRIAEDSRDAVAIAILRIPAIKLVVPVNRGTGRSQLFQGAGLVMGSALPGSTGNVAIAAHRDSFFRGLRHVEVGDVVELDSLEHTNLYRVTDTKVVEPTDVRVLADVGEPVLTLITCYPFYFVGKAPQRFIVRAVATDIRR